MELAENGTVVYHWGLLRFFISLVSGVLQSLSHGQPLEDWPRCFECPTEHPQTGGWYSWLLADSGRIYDMSKVPWLFHVLDVFPLSFTSKNWCQVVPGEFFGIAKETWSPDKGYVQIILQKSISTICTSGRAIGNNQELRTTRKKKKKHRFDLVDVTTLIKYWKRQIETKKSNQLAPNVGNLETPKKVPSKWLSY